MSCVDKKSTINNQRSVQNAISWCPYLISHNVNCIFYNDLNFYYFLNFIMIINVVTSFVINIVTSSLTCLIGVAYNAASCLGVAVARRLVVIATRRDARLTVATVTAVWVGRCWDGCSTASIARSCRQQRHLIGYVSRPNSKQFK